MINHLNALENITQHKFQDLERLGQALTHASAQQQINAKIKKKLQNTHSQKLNHYERLEFLGDRVLGLMISEMLCNFFPQATEGELSVRLNSLVNAETCAEIAIESGLSDMVLMGTDMQNLEERRLYNIYADVVESIIAVIYLEGGLNAVHPFINKFWEKRAKSCTAGQRDAKTILQEWAHQKNKIQPEYRLIQRKGPDHAPLFNIEVCVKDYKPALGQGPSKRMAERAAAQAFIERENIE